MDTDYRAILTEEVALEGLDGITLQALWVRLENRVNFKMRLDEKSREFLWSCLLSIPDLEFYKLETPRGILTAKQPIQIDPDSGVTVDFDVGEDLYPIKIIKTEGSVIGSCSTYYSRQCVTMEIKPNDDSQARPTVKEAEERYGNSLVIVGSQEQRLTALCGEELDPSSLYNMADIGFCVLERIGRSRRAGELSVGESSLQVFNIQPKSMFYHSLRLIKLGILKKQSITVYNKKGQNSLRRLFHLSRFYHQYQSKYTILSNLVVNYLNDQPMKRQEITKTRQDCGIDQKSFKKLYQSYHKRFHVFTIPYNEMYPDSPESNWYTRNADLKMVRVIEVLEEESDEEEDEDGKIEDIDQDETYFPQVYEKSIVRQAMDCMEAAGAEGVSQGQMMKRLSMDNLETRMILRTLGRRGVVTSLMTESGKQKKKVMVSRSFVGGNKFITQINQEKEKLKQSLQDINKQVKEDPEKSVGEIKTEMEDKASKKKDKEKTPKKSEKEKIDEEVQGLVLNMNTQNRNFRTDIKATCRQMKRINYILDFIRENKIIDGIFPIVKMIRDNERSENLEFIVDKKSVIRLLSVLTKEQKVNAVNTVLVDGNKEKKMQMWMSKEVEPTDPLVTSLIDQANMKFQAVNREQVAKKNPKSRDLPEVPETAKEGIYQIMSHRSKLKAEDMIYDVAYSKHYDFRPKFSRAQILHNLLWYLVYDYPNTAVCPSNADLANDPGATPMKAEISNPDSSVEGDQDDIVTLINEIPEPPVYKDEMSWKRYLSPLPKHKGYGEGWFLASDVLLKLPLVIFCNILYIPYRIRGLKELLDDPEKCFYPVISLPTPLTQQLLYARKYIFSFYANCVNLNNMGLVTMGPQILKEKDKIFIYLHKRASLLDTKSSEPG
ncbi:general transcription factor 3C polypeptide 1-like, partial [Saccostrea cucullata]|uniref:general transcription factor 3C polypeptide 1-like n=1 Tax=Saccostrea cuccullata TaxID=36930 RepID=UPI002ED40EF1